MGRPSKLTPDVQQSLVFALTEGATNAHACEFAGIHPDTLYTWMQRGDAAAPGDEAFTEFSEAITRARGRGVVTDLGVISSAVHAGDWKAAAWRLEHRYPKEYGKRVQIQGDPQAPIEIVHRYGRDPAS